MTEFAKDYYKSVMSNEFLDDALSLEYNAVNLKCFHTVKLPDGLNRHLRDNYFVKIRIGFWRNVWENFKKSFFTSGLIRLLFFKKLIGVRTEIYLDNVPAKNLNFSATMNSVLDNYERELNKVGFTLLTTRKLQEIVKQFGAKQKLNGPASIINIASAVGSIANSIFNVAQMSRFLTAAQKAALIADGAYGSISHQVGLANSHFDEDFSFCNSYLKGRYIQNFQPSGLLNTNNSIRSGQVYGGLIHSYGMAIAIKKQANDDGSYDISPIKICKYTWFISNTR